MKKKVNLAIITIVDSEHENHFKRLENDWSRYFYVEQIFDDIKNIANYLEREIGILFINKSKISSFAFDHLSTFQKNNPSFLLVAVSNKRSSEDSKIYKGLVDQIIYLDEDEELLKWNTLAIMRRYWNTYSKPTTIIYKNMIADFVQRNVFVNNNLVSLTNKEFDLLKVLIENRGKFISKKEIFKNIWGFDDEDTTRALDQIIFKLKSKVGDSYFQTKRVKGIKFE